MKTKHTAPIVFACCLILANVLIAPAARAHVNAQQAKAELIALAQTMQPFSMRMLGPPVSTAEWIFAIEPFWNTLVKELSAGKVSATLTSVTDINARPSDALQLVAQGTFDTANMVANYGAGEVPALDGFDLAGVATTVPAIQQALAAYEPVAEAALAKRYPLKLLGSGMSGAQVFYCRGAVNSVADFQGKKVRVQSGTTSALVQSLGAAPVTMAFGEVVPAMQRGVIDCAVTGTMSGNTAKLYEVSDTMYQLVIGWSSTIQVVNRRHWDRLDTTQRQWLQKAMDYYYRHINDVTQTQNVNQGIWCNTNDARCTMIGQHGVTQGRMRLVEPGDADLARVRNAVQQTVLPAFADACGKDCAAAWNDSIGKVVNMRIALD